VAKQREQRGPAAGPRPASYNIGDPPPPTVTNNDRFVPYGGAGNAGDVGSKLQGSHTMRIYLNLVFHKTLLRAPTSSQYGATPVWSVVLH